MSVSVFARDRRLPDLCVFEDGVVHRVTEMCITNFETSNIGHYERPYSAECGRLITGCAVVNTPVNCLECLAGRESLIEDLKQRLKVGL